MTPDRKQELRSGELRLGLSIGELSRLDECLDEIDRLEARQQEHRHRCRTGERGGPMTPERKRELRECNQDKYWDGARYSMTALTECLDEIDCLEARQQEHLALIQRLSQEVPLQSEVSEALAQRGRLLAEIGSLRSQLAEILGPQTIDLNYIGETPDDIEIRPWRTTGDVVRQRSTTAVVAWHRATGLAVVVDGGTYRENAGKAVLRLREALAECNAIWRKR